MLVLNFYINYSDSIEKYSELIIVNKFRSSIYFFLLLS